MNWVSVSHTTQSEKKIVSESLRLQDLSGTGGFILLVCILYLCSRSVLFSISSLTTLTVYYYSLLAPVDERRTKLQGKNAIDALAMWREKVIKEINSGFFYPTPPEKLGEGMQCASKLPLGTDHFIPGGGYGKYRKKIVCRA